MYWLSTPPYLRWLAGCAIIAAAFWVEIAPESTVSHPFASHDIPAGSTVTPRDVVETSVASGLLPGVELPMVTDRSVRSGEPILPATALGATVPEGWWAIDVPVTAHVEPGTSVRLVVADERGGVPWAVNGVVARTTVDTGFGSASALIAVPESAADHVAVAVVEGRASVLIGA